jgi:hypothetical protein
MRVHLLAPDAGAVGHYRLVWPGMVVGEMRPQWDITMSLATDAKVAVTSDGGLLTRGLPKPEDLDLLVMSRPGHPVHLQLMRWMQSHGVAVVVDTDDALWALHRDNAAFRYWGETPDGKPRWWWHKECLASADLATVSTDRLAAYVGKKHQRVEVLRNRLPRAAVAEVPAADKGWQVSWTGVTKSHPTDLLAVGEAVSNVVRRGGSVSVLGDAQGAEKQLGLMPHSAEELPFVSLDKYHEALGEMGGIGIVPLERSVFNDSKSWLKAMEYAGRGMPVVASDTPENRALRRLIPSIRLAKTPDEWGTHLAHFRDEANRRVAGAAGLVYARQRVVLQGHAVEWANAWSRAVQRRRGLTPR